MAAHQGFHEGKVCKIARNDGPRINGEITSRTCRLIGVDGSQLGLFGVRDALRIANDQPQMEGRNMHMLIVPIKGAFDEKPSDDDKNEKEN